MADIVVKLIPIILLISLGIYIKYKNILKQDTVDEVKVFIVNFSMASVLFITFLHMELEREYFLIFFITFILLNVLYFIGTIVNKIECIYHPLTPFITTGFSFGLLGVPLYSIVFGFENLEKFSILGVGHEFYIWIVFYTLMRSKFSDEDFSMKEITMMIKSPLIISVSLGMIFNLIGLEALIQGNVIVMGVLTTLESLASLATPLILIIVGYELRFNKKYMLQSIKFVILRMIIVLAVGYAFKYMVINHIIPYDLMFNYAYFTFLILPIPLSMSLFVGAYTTKEYGELISNTTVLNTIVSIAIFILFVLII